MMCADALYNPVCSDRPNYSYRDLRVWRRSMDLCRIIYEHSSRFPADERYGLVTQMRRAAVSIPSNIAEGQGRLTDKEFRQFLEIARGSLRELETQTLLARDLGYINDAFASRARSVMDEVSRMLNALITKLAP